MLIPPISRLVENTDLFRLRIILRANPEESLVSMQESEEVLICV
jgi:hypothetical protein